MTSTCEDLFTISRASFFSKTPNYYRGHLSKGPIIEKPPYTRVVTIHLGKRLGAGTLLFNVFPKLIRTLFSFNGL